MKQAILNNVRQNRNDREKCSAFLKYEHEVSSHTILRVLKRNEFRSCKSIMKFDLNAIMMKARLQFCLRHKNWTIDDWKNVIWSDETSVILSFRRSKRLQWRTFKKKHVKICIRRRWKEFSEFLFWDCYSYDKKRSFYIWKAETATEKRVAQREIDEINARLKFTVRENWELETSMRRMMLRKTQWWKQSSDKSLIVDDRSRMIYIFPELSIYRESYANIYMR
jgi:hypothetical protein